jgi:hypothetical protein
MPRRKRGHARRAEQGSQSRGDVETQHSCRIRSRPARGHPAWLRPDAVIPGLPRAGLFLIRTDQVAVAVGDMRAYPERLRGHHPCAAAAGEILLGQRSTRLARGPAHQAGTWAGAPAAAANGWRQRSATGQNTRSIHTTWEYVRPEKRTLDTGRAATGAATPMDGAVSSPPEK